MITCGKAARKQSGMNRHQIKRAMHSPMSDEARARKGPRYRSGRLTRTQMKDGKGSTAAKSA